MKDLIIVIAVSSVVVLSATFSNQNNISVERVFEYYEQLKSNKMMLEQIEQARKTTADNERIYVNSKIITY